MYLVGLLEAHGLPSAEVEAVCRKHSVACR